MNKIQLKIFKKDLNNCNSNILYQKEVDKDV